MNMIDVTINDTWTIKMPEHRQAQWAHLWEKARLDSMFEHLSKMDRPLVIDVGAEEGDMPALFASWGCDLILVEPGATVWPNMRATFEANDLPAPLHSFVGFAAADTSFTIDDRGVGTSEVIHDGWPPESLGEMTTEHSFGCLAQHKHIPTIKLDHVVRYDRVVPDDREFAPLPAEIVAAITVDVEGSELAVLKGATRILREHRPLVWVSIHKDLQWMAENYEDGGRAEVFAFMESLGYLGTTLADEHEEHCLFEWVGA